MFSVFLVSMSIEIKLYNYVRSYMIEIDLMELGIRTLNYFKMDLKFHSNSLVVGRVCVHEDSALGICFQYTGIKFSNLPESPQNTILKLKERRRENRKVGKASPRLKPFKKYLPLTIKRSI